MPSVGEESDEERKLAQAVPTGTKPKKKTKKKKTRQQKQEEDIPDMDDDFPEVMPSNGHSAPTKPDSSKSILNLDQKNLNPDNELKKIFGSKVVKAGQKKKARGRAYVKSTWLINAKDNWSQIRKTGISDLVALILLLIIYSFHLL